MGADSDDDVYAALSGALNAAVALKYRTQIVLLEYPAQGNFAWYYQNGNQIFNQWTMDYVSGRVFAGATATLARLSQSGGLTAAHAQLLVSIDYRLSTADASDPALAAVRDSANAGLAKVRMAIAQPTADNGGIKTVDAQTGAVPAAYQPAYQVSTPIATIQSALSGGGDEITVTVPGPQGMRVTLTYTGCVMAAAGPVAWQEATGRGWFAPDPVEQAFTNGTGDVTGYAFLTPPPFSPGPVTAGGTLGRITGLLLSNAPDIHLQGGAAEPVLQAAASASGAPGKWGTPGYPGSVTAAAAAQAGQVARVVLDAFSLVGLGTPDGVTYGRPTVVTAPSNTGGMDDAADLGGGLALSVTPAPTPTVPTLQQSAYVVGVVVATP